MYNRYIPQPDGSFRRDRIHPQNPPPQPRRSPLPPQAPPPPSISEQDPLHMPCEPPVIQNRQNHFHPGNITGFFKRLLPKDLETADLLIIILLLLMAGEKEEDQTNALLTLALYFFM